MSSKYNGTCWRWLRSLGVVDYYAAYVVADGSGGATGFVVYGDDVSVRPIVVLRHF